MGQSQNQYAPLITEGANDIGIGNTGISNKAIAQAGGNQAADDRHNETGDITKGQEDGIACGNLGGAGAR